MNKLTKSRLNIAGFICIPIIVFFLGLIIGHFGIKIKPETPLELTYYRELIQDGDSSILQEIINQVDINNLKYHLKNITKGPHMAGTKDGKLSAEYVYSYWKSIGLDDVELVDYDVFLDFPDEHLYNNVQVKTSSHSVETTFEINEEAFDAELEKAVKPFLAYAPNGSVSSNEIFFVNYGREEDFELLISKGYNLTGKLVICKYGEIFRGNKVKFAENFGASGVLLFDDPIRSAPSFAKDYIYPNGEYITDTGVQRGSILMSDGDPLTVHYPATEYAFRKYDSNILPKIPAQVIGSRIAQEIFNLIELNGAENVPDDWKGEMNTTYTFGGRLRDDKYLTLNVYNQRKVEKIYNVIGCIKGSFEPDRYVMIGNHRDAWTYGALDPNSGTTIMLELSRVLIELKRKQIWSPRRSILFLNWDAEEYGLIGSIEWVEEFREKLKNNGIVYLNLDTAIIGNFSYNARSSPLLFDLILNVTKSIRHDDSTSRTVYDYWLENQPNADGTAPDLNAYLGAGSDHMSFLEYVGIPCIDQSNLRNKNNSLFRTIDLEDYSTYHSSYETYNLVAKFIDPSFQAFKTMTIVVGELTRRLADSLILPFNCVTYANEIRREFEDFSRENNLFLNELNISLETFEFAIKNFSLATVKFHSKLNDLDNTKYHLIRMYNEQLRNVERAFLDTSGLNRNNYLHMIYAPSISNSYGSYAFPSITDAIYDYRKNPASSELIEDIKFQIAVVTYSIQSASSILNEPIDFKRFNR